MGHVICSMLVDGALLLLVKESEGQSAVVFSTGVKGGWDKEPPSLRTDRVLLATLGLGATILGAG